MDPMFRKLVSMFPGNRAKRGRRRGRGQTAWAIPGPQGHGPLHPSQWPLRLAGPHPDAQEMALLPAGVAAVAVQGGVGARPWWLALVVAAPIGLSPLNLLL